MSTDYLVSLIAALGGSGVAYFLVSADRVERIVLAAIVGSAALALGAI